ncbi:MAG: DUF1684 domain-containing protein [Chloroflexota bacterium]
MTNEQHTHQNQENKEHVHTADHKEHDDVRRQHEAFRKQKDKFLAEHPQSPLLPEDKENFRGANYFPVDLKYRVTANFVEETRPGVFKVQTTTGDFKEYTRIGRLEFEIDGQKVSLVAFMPPSDEPLHGNRLFVPFRDKTSGKASYGAGRYLDLNKRPGSQYVLDFNRAYNPYCAYSPYYSCPLPPGENNLAIEIAAGEKSFHDHD